MYTNSKKDHNQEIKQLRLYTEDTFGESTCITDFIPRCHTENALNRSQIKTCGHVSI